jgi:serine/threonine protein kinase
MRLGSCILEEPLGVGGMGAVYLARQERPHRQVAVKVLRPQLVSDPRALRVFLARFRHEADATAALDHANIVPIYEFGEEGDMAYLVMPYLKDGSLATLLARTGTLSLQLTSSYVDQAAAALDHAHQHQLVHRDVKPSNLLLHPDGRLLLADFGIARPIDRSPVAAFDEFNAIDLTVFAADGSLTQTGAAMGTPEYMAPEQVQGDVVGPAADIYALGTVAYVALAGHTPFGGGDVPTVLRRQLVAPPYPLRARRPDVPRAVEEVIFWSLAKEPGDRPATAGEFARALRDAKRGPGLGRLFGWAVAQDLHPSATDTASPPLTPSERTAFVSAHLPSRTQPLAVTGAPSSRAQGADDAFLAPARSSVAVPTVRGLPAVASEATLYDAPVPIASDAAAWPGAHRRPVRRWNMRWLAGSIAAFVVIFALAVAVGLGSMNSGLLAGQPARTPSAVVRSSPAALPTPTATIPPTQIPIPANWLSVSPASLTLGCSTTEHSQIVRLTNAGPTSVRWSAIATTFAGQPEVALSQTSGTLSSGQTTRITVTNRAVIFAHQGSITFRPKSSDAGDNAVVAFTVSPCG